MFPLPYHLHFIFWSPLLVSVRTHRACLLTWGTLTYCMYCKIQIGLSFSKGRLFHHILGSKTEDMDMVKCAVTSKPYMIHWGCRIQLVSVLHRHGHSARGDSLDHAQVTRFRESPCALCQCTLPGECDITYLWTRKKSLLPLPARQEHNGHRSKSSMLLPSWYRKKWYIKVHQVL